MFNINDNVVHLSHGIGIITAIEEREFKPGELQKFYIVTIQDNGAPKKVFVPFDAANIRMRGIISQTDTDKVYEALKQPVEVDGQTWNIRYRAYMDEIHTGDIVKTAKVIKSLWNLKKDKELSFGERKLLDQALQLVVTEMSLAENMPTEEIDARIKDILGE